MGRVVKVREKQMSKRNVTKQSDSVRGKRQDDGLSAAARKHRDSEIMEQKQKKANEEEEEPK
uniref:small EDRK-rich factor 2-like n=1 Tax=Jaculus jaculus TaxID=51337 RepID=UPI001E1B2464|nr:small EDRK-rich factor 2-like [Jaculus jaculus]